MSSSPTSEPPRPNDPAQFYALSSEAALGRPTEALLDDLAGYLNLSQVALRRASARAPDVARAASAPVVFGVRYLGDLVAPLPPEADAEMITERLAVFAPLFAMLLAGETNQHLQMDETPAWLEDLQQERERLEAVLDSTNDALLLLDTRERVVMATRQFETFTGLSRYDLMGQRVGVLAAQIEATPGLPVQMANLFRVLAHNQTESLGGEFEITAPQRRALVWYSVPVYVQSGTLLGRIFAFRDATRERELDRMKTEFIALVSHELRTPLTSVKGFSDLILEDGAGHLDDDQREYMRIIALNADRLIRLLNDILDVARIDSDRVEMKPSACTIPDVIDEVVGTLRPLITARHHRLTLAVDADLPAVWADRDRLIQIMMHLLNNAIKYTLEPGEIKVGARTIRHSDALPPGAPGSPILPCVLFSVADNGLGISSDAQQHLFDRFYRADIQANRQVAGTGLGLTIVRSFVDMHGGAIWLDSAPRDGSTFYFTIPVVEASRLDDF